MVERDEGSSKNPILVKDEDDDDRAGGTLTPPEEEEVVGKEKERVKKRRKVRGSSRTPLSVGESYSSRPKAKKSSIFQEDVSVFNENPLEVFHEYGRKDVAGLNESESLMDRMLQFSVANGMDKLADAVRIFQSKCQIRRGYHSRSNALLYRAASGSHFVPLDRVLGLLNVGVDPTVVLPSYSRSSVHQAAKRGNVDFLAACKVAKMNLEALDQVKKKTPIFYAVEYNKIAAVRFLFENGANIFAKDWEGKTILHYAAYTSSCEVLEYLLTKCSKLINIRDDGGWTALPWAFERERNCDKVVQCLLAHKVDPNIVDKAGNTALHWAVFSRQVVSVNILLSYCRVDAQNLKGDAALHIACRLGYKELVSLLVTRNANRTLENAEGDTPLKVARKLGRAKVIEELKFFPDGIFRLDISKGQEPFPIPCVNDVDDAPLPSDFVYIKSCVEAKGLQIDRSMETVEGCICGDFCAVERHCSCARNSERRRFWFNDGKINLDVKKYKSPLVYECNAKCSCSSECHNRVVQKGMKYRLGVFRTKSKGWGVRAKERIPRGAMICEYAGQLITDEAANRMKDDTYLFDLDIDGDDDGCMCIDACKYGNVSRFINHSCEPNVFPVRVFTDHHDKKFPKMVFFAHQDILEDEEICFDYGERFWNIKHKEFPCSCGTKSCRFGSKKR